MVDFLVMVARRVLVGVLIACITGLVASVARAQTVSSQMPLALQIANGTRITTSSTGVPLVAPAQSVVAGPISGSALVTNTGGVATRAGTLPVSVARGISAGAVARGVAGAARIATPLGVASIILPLLNDVACEKTGTGVMCSPTVPATTQSTWRYSTNANLTPQQLSTANTYGTRAAAVQAISGCELLRLFQASAFQSCTQGERYALGPHFETNPTAPASASGETVTGTVRYGCTNYTNCAGEFQTSTPVSAYEVTAPTCANGQQLMAGGSCVLPGTGQPVTEEQLAERIAPGITPSNVPGLVNESLTRGVAFPSDAPVVTGPASITGSPVTTTTTSPAGTRTETRTQTVHNTYQGDTITHNTTNNTTIVNEAGETTTINEETPAQEPQETECDKRPDALGCQTLDEPPSDAPQWRNVEVSWAAEALGLPAACPPPRPIHVRQWQWALSYQPACDVAPAVRAGILALTALSCLLLVLSAVRT